MYYIKHAKITFSDNICNVCSRLLLVVVVEKGNVILRMMEVYHSILNFYITNVMCDVCVCSLSLSLSL